MQKVSIKRFLFYKGHIFPSVRKPIRSVTQYLMHLNPALDSLKSRKMSQQLDEEEKKKLTVQKDNVNEGINEQLRRYYTKYILPFEDCPDYYTLLFEYARLKMGYFKNKYMGEMEKYEERESQDDEVGKIVEERNIQTEKQSVDKDNKKSKQSVDKDNKKRKLIHKQQLRALQQQSGYDQQQPFYLRRRDVVKLAKSLALKHNPVVLNQPQFTKGVKQQFSKGQQSHVLSRDTMPPTEKQQKLLYRIYKHLYPSQKLIVYNRFNQLYKEFLMNNPDSSILTKYLLDEHVYLVKPFIYSSPLEMYQANHSTLTLKECQLELLTNVQKRDKNNVEFVKLLQQRRQYIQYIQQKFSIHHIELFRQYRKQYYHPQKFNNFYAILRN